MSELVLEVRSLSLATADGRVLVEPLDVDVEAHGSLGVVGESGAGKTLLARACLGLLPSGVTLASGTVRLAGRDVAACSPVELRELLGRNVGYVPQNAVSYLHPGLKVSAQIGDGYRTWFGASRAEALDRARSLLEQVGISDPGRVLASYPGQLSGGMRQRVNIAMAFMGSPALIVADEPTAALDALARSQVAELLRRTCAKNGAALLMVSHDLPLVGRVCEQALVMRHGRVVERGRVADVLAHPESPYVAGLLAAIPRVGRPRDERLPEGVGQEEGELR